MSWIAGATGASAAAPPPLLRFPAESIAPGSGADQLNGARAVAGDPNNGHLFVADNINARVSEFTAWGAFVKAWGWGVVAAGPGDKPRNERQEVTTGGATAGSFSLRAFRPEPDGAGSREQDTALLAFNASAAAVQAALEGLAAFGVGDVAVSGPAGGPWTIEFTGTFADFDILPLRVVGSSLSGGAEPAAVKTLQEGADLEICVPADGDVCKAGNGYTFGKGGGVSPGEFASLLGMAVDEVGDVYVFDSRTEGEASRRAQKFSPDGEFVLMFGGEVNKTTGEDVCTKADLEAGDECGAGVAGSGDGEFQTSEIGDFITYDLATETIFVGDKERIQEFGLDGSFKSKIALPGKTAAALDADTAGNLYATFSGEADVHKMNPSGEAVAPGTFPVPEPVGVAVDEDGNVYAGEAEPGRSQGKYVLGFDAAGSPIAGMQAKDEFAKPEFGGVFREDISGVASNGCAGSEGPDLYVVRSNLAGFSLPLRSYVSVYGPPPAGCEPPPAVAPEIKAQYAVSVNTEEAVLKAQINPKFWTDTTYYVQYGTAPCSEGGCKERPAPPGSKLTAKVTNAPVTTAGVLLQGLQPGTTYHFRFVAQSSGGGPVFGVEGTEGTFRTFSLPTPAGPCPANEGLRGGPSAKLPDCRAYEMVSPLEKNNADVETPTAANELPLSAGDGESFTYSAANAFANPEAAPYISQYLARRSAGGWASQSISPPRTRPAIGDENIAQLLTNEFNAFSADLCTGWLRTSFDPPLAGDAVAGYRNLYRRDNCGGGGYEALTTAAPAPPEPVGPEKYAKLAFQGASADGAHAIFFAPDNLAGSGAPENTNERLQLYEHVAGEGGEAGQLRFVCVLPGGGKSGKPCFAGTTEADGALENGFKSNLHNAISADGSRIFWTESAATLPLIGPGRIYVRMKGKTTADVSKAAETFEGASASWFWSAAADGSAAIFTTGVGSDLREGKAALYHFEVDAKATTKIAGEAFGLLGASEDASRVYFASKEVLSEAENSEGAKAQPGAPNLYLYEAAQGGNPATYNFIATLATADMAISLHRQPFLRASRVTPDGGQAAFTATAALTGYDSTDAQSGEPDAEVYLYDAATGRLICASCNPSGARPTGALVQPDVNAKFWAAALLDGWRRSFYAQRNLSDDGSRLFFESFEALVPRDTNGVKDVYQWEELGKGGCSPGDAGFVADSGGCVDLISSGQSPRASTLLDASADGEDVFISTLASLVPVDDGLVDIYDARVDGGFPTPTAPPECEGEACQSPPPAPQSATPASLTFEGPKRRKCRKAKRRARRGGKKRCHARPRHHRGRGRR